MGAINKRKSIRSDRQLRNVRFLIHLFAILIFFYILFSFVYKANKFNFSLIQDSFSEHGGALQALPNEIVHLYILAQKDGLDRFDLSDSFLSNPLLHQRAVEFLYPIRFEPGVRDLFAIKGEPIFRECRTVASSGRVVHFECTTK